MKMGKNREKCIQCGLWTLYKTTRDDNGRRAGDVGQLQSVAVEGAGQMKPVDKQGQAHLEPVMDGSSI
jgi:hypothetical protein